MAWGFIDKRELAREGDIWIGVEPCETEAQGIARAAELQRLDISHEYRAFAFDRFEDLYCVLYRDAPAADAPPSAAQP